MEPDGTKGPDPQLGGSALPHSEAVQADGDRLEELAEGDGGFIVSVSAYSADNASRSIANTCR